MIYLIGGAPHVGKSLAAEVIARAEAECEVVATSSTGHVEFLEQTSNA